MMRVPGKKERLIRSFAAALAAVMTAGMLFTSCEQKKPEIDISKVSAKELTVKSGKVLFSSI